MQQIDLNQFLIESLEEKDISSIFAVPADNDSVNHNYKKCAFVALECIPTDTGKSDLSKQRD